MKILIVDDTPANLRLLRAVLESEGHEVIEAADGLEGLGILRGEPVDAVISDILMPNMDGYRFCREIRRDQRLRHLPLIITSSTYDSPSDEKLALEMGADKFIKKPAPIHEIIGALAELVTTGPRAAKEFPPEEELHLSKMYNEALVNKLEQKNRELFEHGEALRLSEEKFRQLAENLNEVCWIASLDMTEILYINPAYEKTWGRPCRELYENPKLFVDGVCSEDRFLILDAMEKLRKGEPYDIEYRVRRPDGVIRWVHDRGSAIRNDKGVIYRVAGIAEDITVRRSTEEQLRQAQKMEAVGQLAGGVAHDFNNLLTIIGGSLELLVLANPKLDPVTMEYLEDISNAADRAATLNRQLLAFSRSEAMQMQTVNLNDLTGAFSKLLRRILGEDIRLVTDFAAHLPAIKADPGMVEQILMNLVVNARDAMPAGGQLTISTGLQNSRLRPGNFVCLSVRDTGTGIAPENMPRIFEPFFTTKGASKGTGLGLATVFGIVEQHGGWIDVSSEVNLGTVFHVFLPATEESAVAAEESESRQTRGGREQILLVEDDQAVRGVMTEMLQRQGYTVLAADSGISARQIWLSQGHNVDLLLADVVMPGGITGLELAELLRLQKPDLKVVLTSGYSSQLLSKGLARTKHISFLRKPFSTRTLAEAVRKSLDGP